MDEKTKQTGFRMSKSLIDRLDTYAEQMSSEMTGYKVTRADAVRMLLEQGLKNAAIDDAARIAADKDTREHIREVADFIIDIINELQKRAATHDASKLEEPELSMFAEWGPKLKQMEYGTDEYKAALSKMGDALQHHYENNRHHPEHHGDAGIDGMNLVDVVEMVCDWVAASKRMKDGGSFMDSLEHNRKRFNLSPQLVRIIANTANLLGE